MPYKIVPLGPRRYAVYRKGRPNIKPLGVHKSRKAAQEQVAALHAKEKKH